MLTDSELVQVIAVLARAGQDTVWARQQVANQLRSLLREYFPAALTAFHIKHLAVVGQTEAVKWLRRRAVFHVSSSPAVTRRGRIAIYLARHHAVPIRHHKL